MYRSLFCILFFFVSLSAVAQEKVNWTFDFNPTGNLVEVKAVIADGWHLYSQYIDDGIGPIPTAFEFQENPNVKFIGKTLEPESIREYDPNFEGDLNFFKDEVVFTQKVKITEPTEIKGMVTYMICNDVMCMPPVDENFRITTNR
jgi:thiol:disulfide interchange protein DsbD